MKPKRSGLEYRIHRIGGMLKSFFENNQVYSASLGEKFHVDIRTIQRDFELMKKTGFPIQKIKNGCYCLDKNLFRNFEFFDETELALVFAVQHVISQLGPTFEKAGNSVFNRLFHVMAEPSSSPVFIKLDAPIRLETHVFKKASKAINEKKTVSFDYDVYAPYSVHLEPYKIAFYEGIWYLVGKETTNDRIKTYAFDKIKNLRVLKKGFRSVPQNLEETLNDSANAWFTGKKTLHVEILADESCAPYFKRRKIFPTQEIKKINKDGSMIVSFVVSSFNEIQYTLKKWLPHIKILSPEDFKNEFTDEINSWIDWQNG